MARRSRSRTLDDVPAVHRRRSNFDLSHRVATTMKVGKLTPIDIVEVLPGDTWSVTPASLTRLSVPLVRPIMDDMFLDTYSFFVPLRLVFDETESVFGDSSPSAYDTPDLATFPLASTVDSDNTIAPGTVLDYLGLPSDISLPDEAVPVSGGWSILPARAFALIWNEFFRSEQVDDPVYIYKENWMSDLELPNNGSWSPTNYTGQLPPVRRYGDLFSTCVVKPQKGPSVLVPGIAKAPISTVSNSVVTGAHSSMIVRFSSSGNVPSQGLFAGTSSTGSLGLGSSGTTFSGNGVYPSNLVIDDSNPGYTINALRTAFQLQKYLERDSIFGSRYREYLYASYGVTSPDSRLQLPEFLAGAHNRLNIAQIPSTSATTSDPLGQYGANINSLSEHSGRFSKSFTEHGYIITVGCIRYKHLYSQAVAPLFRRSSRTDFYDPLFANLGQQAIMTNSVVGSADSGETPTVFGYNEAFASYRTILDRVSGQMRPISGNIGQYWSLADKFTSIPSLADIIHENGDSFDRVLVAGSGSGVDPFIIDFNFRCSVARVVSPYSIPGYADHH
ncbi:major capsid protein [Peromfec virus RodF5_17]|uniref:Major capsid protein n=1 Tax=Peromfec virus RodF5_17 TaxID=2929338 RepID=A0A976N2U1_9VIRU|nr:major capsid protein [Peromfec virus RodF5_17]